MVPICYTSSSIFRFQAEKKKFDEHFDENDHEEVSEINDDDYVVDNHQNDVDFAFRNCF